MTTSGTYTDLGYDIASFVDEAWERAGLDPSTLAVRHLVSARRSLNLMFSEWANKTGSSPFRIEQMENVPMVVSQANYLMDQWAGPPVRNDGATLAILGPIFIRNSLATPIQFMSRDDYERIPNKTYAGIATNMFFDRPTQTAYMWPVGQFTTDAIGFWRLRRSQDVLTAAETPDVPYQWYEALASGLSARLAQKFNPPKYGELKSEAAEKFNDARSFDRERAPTSFQIERL